MTRMMVLCFAVLVALPGLTGCRKPVLSDLDRREKLFSDVHTLLQTGSTNAAISKLSTALHDDRYDQSHVQILGYLVAVHLEAGLNEEARTLYIDTVAKRPTLAAGGFTQLYRHTAESTNQADVVAWTTQLTRLPLTGRIAMQAFEWHFQAVYQISGVDGVLPAVGRCLDILGDSAEPVLDRFIRSLLRQTRLEDADILLTQLREQAADRGHLQKMLDVRRIELLALRKEWDPAVAYLLDRLTDLPDALARDAFDILAAHLAAADTRRLDGLCATVLEQGRGKELLRRNAAYRWLKNAAEARAPADIASRLETCLNVSLPVNLVRALYQRYFYSVVGGPDPDATRAIMTFGRTLRNRVEDADAQAGITTTLLDAAFVLNDFDAALGMIEGGIPNRSETWHKMAASKLRAHAALQNGDTRAAIQHFRDFMAVIAESYEEPEVDPTTGLAHTRNMLLGRNAKRIGDLLAKEDTVASEDAYREARGYYEQALDEVKPGSEEMKLIRSEMAAIPDAASPQSEPATNTTAP